MTDDKAAQSAGERYGTEPNWLLVWLWLLAAAFAAAGNALIANGQGKNGCCEGIGFVAADTDQIWIGVGLLFVALLTVLGQLFFFAWRKESRFQVELLIRAGATRARPSEDIIESASVLGHRDRGAGDENRTRVISLED